MAYILTYSFSLSDILPGIYSGLAAHVFPDSLSDILPGIVSDILFDIYSGMLSGI